MEPILPIVAAPAEAEASLAEGPLRDKYLALRTRLEGLGEAVIGFSGGVDSALLAAVARRALVDGLKRTGFRKVVLDLEGFRSGSLNDSLGDAVKREGRSPDQRRGSTSQVT